MMGRRALFMLLVATPAAAQPMAPAVPPPTLAPPALAPPALAPLPSVTLGRGVTALPPGVWRVTFPPERDALEPEQRAALGRLAAVLKTGTIGRITLLAEAGTGDDLSTHRRLTLARARAVKAALAAGGLEETRIDIRALGRTPNGRNSVDVLAPTAPRT